MTLHSIAQAVARELAGWTHHPHARGYEHIAYLRHEETGAEVSLRSETSPPSAKGKLEVKGVYPDPYGGHDNSSAPSYWGVVPYGSRGPCIHVTATRSAADIAAEFRRRFEPEFWPVWYAVQQKHLARLLELDRRERLFYDLLAVAGGSRYQSNSRDLRGGFYFSNEPHKTHAEIEVYDDSVNIKLSSVPGTVALELMRLLAAMRNQ